MPARPHDAEELSPRGDAGHRPFLAHEIAPRVEAAPGEELEEFLGRGLTRP